MCTIVKNVKPECCNNLDIMLPSLTKDDLEYVVEFLYTGQISCPDKETVSQVLTNLSKLLGFPEGMDLSEAPVKSESTNYRANFRQSYEDNDSQFESPEDLGVGVKVEFNDYDDSMDQSYSNETHQKHGISMPSDFDVTTVTWGAGVCPLCEKVCHLFRDVTARATGATAVAPKFSDALTLFQPVGADSALPLQRSHQKFPCGYISELYIF